MQQTSTTQHSNPDETELDNTRHTYTLAERKAYFAIKVGENKARQLAIYEAYKAMSVEDKAKQRAKVKADRANVKAKNLARTLQRCRQPEVAQDRAESTKRQKEQHRTTIDAEASLENPKRDAQHEESTMQQKGQETETIDAEASYEDLKHKAQMQLEKEKAAISDEEDRAFGAKWRQHGAPTMPPMKEEQPYQKLDPKDGTAEHKGDAATPDSKEGTAEHKGEPDPIHNPSAVAESKSEKPSPATIETPKPLSNEWTKVKHRGMAARMVGGIKLAH
jgi:hypothetical protein